MDRFSKSWKCLAESTFQGSNPTAAISFSAAEEKPGRSGWSGGLGEKLWQASIRRVRIGNKARGLSGDDPQADRRPKRPMWVGSQPGGVSFIFWESSWRVQGNAVVPSSRNF